jgi:hypothetical protein
VRVVEALHGRDAPSVSSPLSRHVLVIVGLAASDPQTAIFDENQGMRVHIVGLPSSGKTTLAKGLSAHLNLPHHDLDAVAFLDEAWSPRPALERDRLVAEILTSRDWVTEGYFLGWATPFLAAADHVVWLDPSLPRLLYRHIRRHRRRVFQTRWLSARLRFQVHSYRRPAGSGPAANDPSLTRSGIELALRPWAQKVLKADTR